MSNTLDISKITQQTNTGGASIPGDHQLLTNRTANNTHPDESISTDTDGLATTISTLQDFKNYTWSASIVSGLDITDNGDGTVNITQGEALLRSADSVSSPIILYQIPAINNLVIPDNDISYLIADYNAGIPQMAIVSDIKTVWNQSTTPVFIISRVGLELDWIKLENYNLDYPGKHAIRDVCITWFEHSAGAITSEVSTRNLSITAGLFYFTSIRLPTPAFDTSVADTFTYNYLLNGAWQRITSQTQLNNTQYNDITVPGSESLTTLGSQKYKVDWVYMKIDNPTKLSIVYSQLSYNNLAEAQSSDPPLSLPPDLESFGTAVLIAKVIIKNGDTNITEIQNPFRTIFSSSEASTHNNLAGLQGGTSDEYYHLTQSEHNTLTNQLYGEMFSFENLTATEIGTATQFEDVVTLSAGQLNGFVFSGGGFLTASAGTSGVFLITVSVSSQATSANKDFEMAVFKNDVQQNNITSKRRFSNADLGSQSLGGLITIVPTDIINLQVANLTDTSNITLFDVNLTIHKIGE
jgi:hypothetical protein